MKLFKKSDKKDIDSSSRDIPGPASAQKKLQIPAGNYKKMVNYQYVAIFVVFLSFLLCAFMVDRIVLDSSESAAIKKQSQSAASLVSGVFEYQARYLTTQAKAIAGSTLVRQGLADTSQFNLDQSLRQAFPYVVKAYLFRRDGVRRRMANGEQLSFASLDMLKRIDRGETLQPEAFFRDDRWYIQVANAVTSESGEIEGSLLLMYSPRIFSDLLQGVSGKTSVIQVQGDTEKAFVEQGQGAGATHKIHSSVVSAWQLIYQLPASGRFWDRTYYWSVMVGGSLIGVLCVFLTLGSLLGKVRKDLVDVTQYASRLLFGERKRVPPLTFSEFDSMARNLERTRKAADKKPVDQNARGESEADQYGDASTSTDEKKSPLTDAASGLDVAMMEGDEDLFGMAETNAPAEPDAASVNSDALFDDDDDLLSSAILDDRALTDENTELGSSEGPGTVFEGGLDIEEVAPVDVPQTIFRAYDIRGIVGQSVTPGLAVHIGRAIGSEAKVRGQSTIAVGHDGRLSGPELADSLVTGLVQSGIDVIEIGQVPTPVLYFATHQLVTGSGVMITGSHNPANYNGFKIVLGGDTLAGDEIQKLYQRILLQDYKSGQGSRTRQDVSRDYIDAILNDIAVAAPLRIVIDAGNGVAGELASLIVEELGCEVIPLHCDVDGNFPNHHPDPGKPENLVELIEMVQDEGADLGIAFDGDGDCLGVVTDKGQIIWPDRLLMLFAKDVVSRNPGADIIFDVKCSRRLNALVSEYGGRPVMWKTGHSLIKRKMKETGALLAGEMSGHVFFKERWLGFDDAIYAAARLLEILGLDDRSVQEIFDGFPEDVCTPEISIEVTEENKFTVVDRLSSVGQFGDANITHIDGVRVDYSDGWGLCRASNTSPMLVLRFEATDEVALERIKSVFREQLLRVDAALDIPF